MKKRTLPYLHCLCSLLLIAFVGQKVSAAEFSRRCVLQGGLACVAAAKVGLPSFSEAPPAPIFTAAQNFTYRRDAWFFELKRRFDTDPSVEFIDFLVPSKKDFFSANPRAEALAHKLTKIEESLSLEFGVPIEHIWEEVDTPLGYNRAFGLGNDMIFSGSNSFTEVTRRYPSLGKAFATRLEEEVRLVDPVFANKIKWNNTSAEERAAHADSPGVQPKTSVAWRETCWRSHPFLREKPLAEKIASAEELTELEFRLSSELKIPVERLWEAIDYWQKPEQDLDFRVGNRNRPFARRRRFARLSQAVYDRYINLVEVIEPELAQIVRAQQAKIGNVPKVETLPHPVTEVGRTPPVQGLVQKAAEHLLAAEPQASIEKEPQLALPPPSLHQEVCPSYLEPENVPVSIEEEPLE